MGKGYAPAKNREYLRNRYAKQRALLMGKLGSSCAHCGATDDLEIDHIEPRLKLLTVGRLWPEKRIPEVVEELRKCQLLCRPCHIAKTAKEKSVEVGWRHGTSYAWMKKKCQCRECMAHKREFNDRRNAKRRKRRRKA